MNYCFMTDFFIIFFCIWEPDETFWNCVHIWAKYLLYGEEDYHNSTFLEWLADGKTEVKNGGNDENENEGEEDSDMGEDYQTFNQNRLVHPATGNSRVKSSFYYGIKHWLKIHKK